jgi:hypothetical protein
MPHKQTEPTQIGGSQRGPAQLDHAKRNRGIHEADVTIDAPDERPLSSGETVESQRRRQAQDQPQGEADRGR